MFALKTEVMNHKFKKEKRFSVKYVVWCDPSWIPIVLLRFRMQLYALDHFGRSWK